MWAEWGEPWPWMWSTIKTFLIQLGVAWLNVPAYKNTSFTRESSWSGFSRLMLVLYMQIIFFQLCNLYTCSLKSWNQLFLRSPPDIWCFYGYCGGGRAQAKPKRAPWWWWLWIFTFLLLVITSYLACVHWLVLWCFTRNIDHWLVLSLIMPTMIPGWYLYRGRIWGWVTPRDDLFLHQAF